MARLDDATRSLAGHTIWHVAEWLEAHYDGTPYEIFSNDSDPDERGYRLTVERIPRSPMVGIPMADVTMSDEAKPGVTRWEDLDPRVQERYSGKPREGDIGSTDERSEDIHR